MDEFERRVVDDLIEGRVDNHKLVTKLFKWLVIGLIAVAMCFTIATMTVVISLTKTMQESTHDYFYSDYDYGVIEQSVTQKVEQEVK